MIIKIRVEIKEKRKNNKNRQPPFKIQRRDAAKINILK